MPAVNNRGTGTQDGGTTLPKPEADRAQRWKGGYTGSMIWIFRRDDEVTRLETSFDNTTQEYVLRIMWAHRPEGVERFASEAAFDERIHLLERKLAREQWIQSGPPILMAEGWRGPSR